MSTYKKHYEGVYRVKLSDDKFAQIIKGREIYGAFQQDASGRVWAAEVRSSRTGAIIRYAGIWNTRREALLESEWVSR